MQILSRLYIIVLFVSALNFCILRQWSTQPPHHDSSTTNHRKTEYLWKTVGSVSEAVKNLTWRCGFMSCIVWNWFDDISFLLLYLNRARLVFPLLSVKYRVWMFLLPLLIRRVGGLSFIAGALNQAWGGHKIRLVSSKMKTYAGRCGGHLWENRTFTQHWM